MNTQLKAKEGSEQVELPVSEFDVSQVLDVYHWNLFLIELVLIVKACFWEVDFNNIPVIYLLL